MKYLLYIALVGLLITKCFSSSTLRKPRPPFHNKVEGLFEIFGYSTPCATATLMACRTNCPQDIQKTIWQAKNSVDYAMAELSNAMMQLENTVDCFPRDTFQASIPASSKGSSSMMPHLPPIGNLVRAEKLTSVSKPNFFPKNCLDIKARGFNKSDVYEIYPDQYYPTDAKLVYCDQETDGGGWIVIQRRQLQHPRENFNREWKDYVKGFGHKSHEFWLGLDLIHELTTSNLTELRIDLEDAEGNKRFAKYAYFNVGNRASKYQMNVYGYTGDAGDSLEFHNGKKFTTIDQDNDDYRINCAEQGKGGWWYNTCLYSNLNGYPHIGKAKHAEGVVWFTWHGYSYSLLKASMKIRPSWWK